MDNEHAHELTKAILELTKVLEAQLEMIDTTNRRLDFNNGHLAAVAQELLDLRKQLEKK